MSCGAERLTVSCDANAAGVWSCSCTQGEARTDFEFPDTTGTRTCEVAANACLHPELISGEETCTVADEVKGPICSVLDTCRREYEIDGVKLSAKTEFTAECEPLSETLSGCKCPGSRAPVYWVPTNDFTTGCDFLSPLCRGDLTPNDDWTCEPVQEYSAPDYGCSSGALCTRPVTLNGGSDLTLVEQIGSQCADDDGVTRCVCTGGSSYPKLTLLHGLSPDDIASCRFTTDVCVGLEAIDFRGSPECTPTTDTKSSESCSLVLACNQSGTAGDNELAVLTNRGATCDRLSDGGWSCTCYGSMPDSVSVRVEAEDSTSACTEAAAECPLRASGYD